MKELELFQESIPQIAEMITICKGLTLKEYTDFKRDTLHNASESSRPFMQKVFAVIEMYL